MTYDVEKYEEFLSEEELETILSSYYTEEDWDKRTGSVRSFYTLQNNFTSKEHAKEVINRVLTALMRYREDYWK